MNDPLLGMSIGRYRLVRQLGEGGMGRVYVAEHETIGTRVAIKVMFDHGADRADRFFAEARAVGLVSHEAIVKIVDLANLPDGRPYIVMELVDGETLRELIAGAGSLPAGGVIDVIVEVLSALGAVHAAGIVHRDLKPDNIMIAPSGRVRVLDFGIAKLSPWTGGALPRTQTGARIGTPEYMAPEQIRGTAVDGRTDLYAVGVVLFEALTGARPFAADNEFELMRAHLEDRPPSVRETRPALGPELDNVIATALAKAPADRFRSASAMANALRTVRATLPVDELRALVGRSETHAGETLVEPTAPAAGPISQARTPMLAPRPSGNVSIVRPPTAATILDISVERLAVPPPKQPAAVVALVAGVGRGTSLPPKRRGRAIAIGLLVAVGLGGGVLALVERRESAPVVAATAMPPPVMAVDAGAAPEVPEAKRLSLVIDYDPASFDPIAYLPHTFELAHHVAADAELVELELTDVIANGTATLEDPSVYIFHSHDGGKDPDGHPTHCISVTVTLIGATTAFAPDPVCVGLAPVAPPHCTLAEVWTQAHPKTDKTKIVWRGGAWEVAVDANGGALRRLPDPCAHPRIAAHAGSATTATTTAAPAELVDAGSAPADAEPQPSDAGTPLAPDPTPPGARVFTLRIADPTRFDAIAFIPSALQLARQSFPDAALSGLHLDSVHADGRIDLTHADAGGHGHDRFEFWSPSHAQTGETRVPCRAIIDVRARTVEVTFDRPGTCRFDRRTPRCSLTTVWSRAPPPNTGDVGTIEWQPGRWAVTFGSATSSVGDNCP